MAKQCRAMVRLLFGAVALSWACMAGSQGVIAWHERLYNPQPLPDDVILPMPCGGAMAFRAVLTPARGRDYPVSGGFDDAAGAPYLLMGKYEVTRLQYQAVQAQSEGISCPQAATDATTPQLIDRSEAIEFADHYALWLAANAEKFSNCRAGASPCVPQVDRVPAFVRLPLGIEWEYAARGGLLVRAAQFGATRYPMPEGLNNHAWFQANASGSVKPIGQRVANPLGLHDLYGNVGELMLDLYHAIQRPSQRGAAMVRGGSVLSGVADLGAGQRQEVPLYDDGNARKTGIRLLAAVPVFTSPEKVQAAEHKSADDDVVPLSRPPTPLTFHGHLQVTVNVAANVLVDGKVRGHASADQPLQIVDIPVGEHRLEIQAYGYASVTQMHRIKTHQWVHVDVALEQKRWRDAHTGMAFVWIESGRFEMGSHTSEADRYRDELRHGVQLTQGFWLGQYEVTQGQWAQVMESNPSYFAQCGADCPVEMVSWRDVQEFIARLNKKTGQNFRLPTEAEWEHACRSGGKDERYCGGDDLPRFAWYAANSGGKTHVVGARAANGLGLYDMSGNVWEWVQDWYGAYANALVADPSGPALGVNHVIRGGGSNDAAQWCRSALRNYRSGDAGDNLGLRLARSP